MANNEVTTSITITGNADNALVALDKTQQQLKKTETATTSLHDGVLNLNTKFTALSSIAGMAAGALGGMGITAIATQLLNAGMAAERLRNSFEAATGSARKGGDAYSYAREQSYKLGLDLQSTADAFLKLTASAKGTSLEGEKTEKIFSSVAGASRALGLSNDQMSGALLAISQMMSKGTVQAEELRGQLGERLPGAFQIAARSMGVTTAELGKMLEGGKVISADFLPKFAAELEKTFPPGEKAVAGLTAETMRLKTAFFELKTQVMDSGGESLATGMTRMFTGATVAATEYLRTLDKIGAKLPAGLIVGGATVGGFVLGGPLGGGLAAGAASAGVMATANASGARNDYGKIRPPLTAADKALIGGGDYGFSAKTDSLFTPQFSNRTRGADEYTSNFGTMLNRDPAYEAVKPKSGAHARPQDLLLEQIKTYKTDMERINTILIAESGAMEGEGSLSALAFGLNGPGSTGNRYKNTDKYSFLGPGKNGIPGSVSFGDVDASANAWADNKAAAAKDTANSNTFLAMQASQAGSEKTAGMMLIDKEEQYWRDNWAMKTSSLQEYESRNMQIMQYYSEQRKALDRNETSYKIGEYGKYASQASALANNLATLSGKRNKDMFNAAKGTSLASTAINTAEAVMKAYAQTGIFGGPIAAALVAAVGASQMAIIASQQPDSGDSVSGGGGGSFSMPGTAPMTAAPPLTSPWHLMVPPLLMNRS
jgi:tape measure domain-containing protein